MPEQSGDGVEQICRGYCTTFPVATGPLVWNCMGSQ